MWNSWYAFAGRGCANLAATSYGSRQRQNSHSCYTDDDMLQSCCQFMYEIPSKQWPFTNVLLCYNYTAVIIGRIMDKVYGVRQKSANITRAHLRELESQLQQWFVNLPECLTYYISSNRPIPPPHILVLHCQYWSTVILLHRRLWVSFTVDIVDPDNIWSSIPQKQRYEDILSSSCRTNRRKLT